ncbi:MAG: DNA polymerase III subunit gamma/tau [Planctomycetia bacterium]|nr:DNA polymerase III subunit gamma/tau [Planctomycetia bacterium]
MAAEREYQVVARRYRPQNFAELVGQEHIAKALANAIAANRIGHAYLFTGARGVGKTSSARIFAKSLNCVQGPTITPCNECEVCRSISAGEDLDVLEIDGASNRGIDEIRSLRQNVTVRPVRSRFKIYIIDEVHMLTREAFNALLKTLEEPPEHVKFIFCTTEAGKIPITILSRCQRFDFAGISVPNIAQRLREIIASEGLEAEPEAVELLAKRAAGSMRDGQSLLEQLLAFASGKITLQDVHQFLGTADEDVLVSILDAIVHHAPGNILRLIDTAAHEGSDPALLLEQLFGYLRDLMAILAGCGAESFLFASPALEERMREFAQSLGLETVLAAMQIADHTLARLKISTQARLLVEMAFIRICSLGNLDNLSDLIANLQKDVPPAALVGSNAGSNAESNAGSNTASAPALSPPQNDVRQARNLPREKTPIVPPPGLMRNFSQELADAPPISPRRALQDSATRQVAPQEEPPKAPASRPPFPDESEYCPDEPLDCAPRAAPPQDTPAGSASEASIKRAFLNVAAQFAEKSAEFLPEFENFHYNSQNQTVVVEYHNDFSFVVQKFLRTEAKAAVQSRLSAAAGGQIVLELRVLESADRKVASRVPPDLRKLCAHPLIHAAEEIFNASVSKVEQSDEQ